MDSLKSFNVGYFQYLWKIPFWVPPKDFANIYWCSCNSEQQIEQIEKANAFKRDDLFNARKNTENENRVVLTFPLNKAAATSKQKITLTHPLNHELLLIKGREWHNGMVHQLGIGRCPFQSSLMWSGRFWDPTSIWGSGFIPLYLL